LDGVVDDALRRDLLSLLHGKKFDPERGVDGRVWEQGAFSDVVGGASSTWGLRSSSHARLLSDPPPPALRELEARLSKLLLALNDGASVTLCRMPEACFGPSVPSVGGNAPVAADADGGYSYHIDADPSLLPPSPWLDVHGHYPNRCPGKPRFVTAVVYVNEAWGETWGAGTVFLDPPTEETVEVEVRPGRVVLMDQVRATQRASTST
jgi:hypothetical protein